MNKKLPDAILTSSSSQVLDAKLGKGELSAAYPGQQK